MTKEQKIIFVTKCKELSIGLSKSQFKNKYGNNYKICCKHKLIDDIFGKEYKIYRTNYDLNIYTEEFLLHELNTKNISELSTSVKKILKNMYGYSDDDIREIIKNKISKKSKDIKKNKIQKYSKIIKKYTFETELKYNNPEIYKFFKNNGIKTHLIPARISKPQLILKRLLDKLFNVESSFNDRKVIKPLEIDIYYDEYKLGFEYDGIAWHTNIDKDIIKDNICKLNNIELIRIKEITGKDNDIENIKNKLIDKLLIINKITKLNITKEQIINIHINDKDIIDHCINEYKIIAKKYDNNKDFRLNEPKVYDNSKKLKIFNLITNHFVKKHLYTENEISILLKNNICSQSKEYRYAKKYYKHLIKEHFLNNNKRISNEYFDDEYIFKNYKSLFSLKNNKPLYNSMLKNKRDIITKLPYITKDELIIIINNNSLKKFEKTKEYTDLVNNKCLNIILNYYEDLNYNLYFMLNLNLYKIQKICSEFTTIKDFKKQYPKILKYLYENKLVNEYFCNVDFKFRNNKKALSLN